MRCFKSSWIVLFASLRADGRAHLKLSRARVLSPRSVFPCEDCMQAGVIVS